MTTENQPARMGDELPDWALAKAFHEASAPPRAITESAIAFMVRVMDRARELSAHGGDGGGGEWGFCCYGGRRPRSACASCAAWEADVEPYQLGASQEYDRDLIADMLDGLHSDACAWSVEAIQDQARLLRDADNRESRARTVCRATQQPASGEVVDLKQFRPAVIAWGHEFEQRYTDSDGVFHLKLGPNHYRALALLDVIDAAATRDTQL